MGITEVIQMMRENCLLFKEDLMKEHFHPRNIPKFGHWEFWDDNE